MHPWRRFKLASFSITDNGIKRGVESLLILNSVSTYKIRQVYILIVNVYKLAKIISEKEDDVTYLIYL